MGYSGLRAGQPEVLAMLMAGQDVICVLPTGTGKTSCYVLPTLAMNWHTLVFSPLTALMRDQVQGMVRRGVKAAAMSSLQTDAENQLTVRRWQAGDLQVLLVAPERLRNELFQQAVRAVPPDMIAIDEVHCFPGDTFVETEFGPTTLLELFVTSEAGLPLPRVASVNQEGATELRQVTRVWRNPPAPLLRLSLQSIGVIEVTSNHMIFTTKGEVPAGQLLPGDLVLSRRCGGDLDEVLGMAEVESITPSPREEDALFDLEVDEHHNYFVRARVGGKVTPASILVHNCLSSWSDNFRPDYCKIGDFIAEYNPKVVSAFTATCPAEVEADVRRVLGLGEAKMHVYYPTRKNLDLRSRDLQNPYDVADVLRDVPGSAIVYCSTIKRVQEQTNLLQTALPGDEVVMFYGDMSPDAKRVNMDLFMESKARIVVATNAFGMGVDKPDVRAVINADTPGSLEAVAQQDGRAGRDGLPSLCMSFHSDAALRTQNFFIDGGHPPKQTVFKFFEALKRATDASGVIKMTNSEMAKALGINSFHIDSVVHILTGNQVIERAKPVDRMSSVMVRKAPTEDLSDPNVVRFLTYMEALRGISSQGLAGALEFDLDNLATRMGVSDTTVRRYLNQWHKDEWINFVAPFKGKTTRIIGDLSRVDFDRLQASALNAHKKLDMVVEYMRIPDSKKHAYLAKYFLGDRAGNFD